MMDRLIRKGGLQCWTGAGLCGEGAGAEVTPPPPELGLLPPQKLRELQTPLAEMHHWEAEEVICPTRHRAMQRRHLREEQEMCDGNTLNIDCSAVVFLHFAC